MKHIVQLSIGAVAVAVVGTNYLVHRKATTPPSAPAVAAAPAGPVLIPPNARAAAPSPVAPRPQAMAPAPAQPAVPQPASTSAVETNGGVQRPADPPPVMYRPPQRPPRAPQQ
ncbi:MAG: hypothetical protein U1E28_00940 [Beijerinckiaceae bacterium]